MDFPQRINMQLVADVFDAVSKFPRHHRTYIIKRNDLNSTVLVWFWNVLSGCNSIQNVQVCPQDMWLLDIEIESNQW